MEADIVAQVEGVGRREPGGGEELPAAFGRAVLGGRGRTAGVGGIGCAQEGFEPPAGFFDAGEIGPAPVFVRQNLPRLRPGCVRERVRPQHLRGLRDGQEVVHAGGRVRGRGQGDGGPRAGGGQDGRPFEPKRRGSPRGDVGLDRDRGGIRNAQRRARGGDGAEEIRPGFGPRGGDRESGSEQRAGQADSNGESVAHRESSMPDSRSRGKAGGPAPPAANTRRMRHLEAEKSKKRQKYRIFKPQRPKNGEKWSENAKNRSQK